MTAAVNPGFVQLGYTTNDMARAQAFLRDTGCDEGQGFLLSRPVPADMLPRLLEAPPLKLDEAFAAASPQRAVEPSSQEGADAIAGAQR